MDNEGSSKADRRYFRLEGLDTLVEYKIVKEPFDVASYDYKEAQLRDISAGGLSYVSMDKADLGMEIRVKLPLQNEPLGLIGEVVRVQESDEKDGAFETAIKFIAVDEAEQDKIIGFIFQKQLEFRRRGLR